MNAPHPRLSVCRTVACVAAVSLATMLCACDKKTDGAAAAGSASAGAMTPPAKAGKKPKTTLKLADVKSAYKSEIDNMSKMKDPMDKKVGAFVTKIGKPESDNGRKKTWYALDGDKCTKIVIDGNDGSIEESTTDKADCGL